MERIPVSFYFLYGCCIEYLRSPTEGYPIHGPLNVISIIDSCLRNVDYLNLQVSRRLVGSLVEFRDRIAEEEKDACLTIEQARELRRIMEQISTTLLAEIQGYYAYRVTPKRIDVEKLINDVTSLFSPGVFNRLTEIAQYDFNEGGKCIAFERPTAAAFHILRGTESTLRDFYCRLVLRSRVRRLLWKPMIEDLRAHQKTRLYEKLYSHLDNIRYEDRNPTQHPEKIWDIHEVQNLWAICTEAVEQMTAILIEKGMV